MLAEQTTAPPIDALEPVADRADLLAAIAAARAVFVEETVGEYVVSILRHTRQSALLALGASPRAGIALLRMAKARAVAQGRDYVVPEDIQSVAPASSRAPGDRRARGPRGRYARGEMRSSARSRRRPRRDDARLRLALTEEAMFFPAPWVLRVWRGR